MPSLLGAPAALAAQARPVPQLVRQAVAVNPLALPFGAVSGEYERALGVGGFAFGVGGTVALDNTYALGASDDRYASAQFKLKYYPAENGLRGFAVGVTAGLVHGRAVSSGPYTLPCIPTGCTSAAEPGRSATAPTLGVVLDYNWFVGRRRRFLVGAGLGARRVLASSADRAVVGDALPDGRLVVGYGF